MIRIAHLSDLHFGRIDPYVVSSLSHDLSSEMPDYAVITGDLTQRATLSEFRAASEFIEKIPGAAVIVPGNHDLPYLQLWLRFFQPFKRFQSYISPDLNPVIIKDQIALAGLNSARPIGWHWNWSHGRISHWQLDLLRKSFSTVPAEALKIVATHHPIVPPPDKPNQRLIGRARVFARALAETGTDIVLTGHLHRDRHANLSQHYPLIERSILVFQSGTATSTRLRGEVNTYTILTYSAPVLTAEKRVWTGSSFHAQQLIQYEKGSTGWRPTR